MPENSSTDAGDATTIRSKRSKGKQDPTERPPRGESHSVETRPSAEPPAESVQSSLAAFPGMSLLSFSGPVETVSNLPGRARFRTNAVVGREAAGDLLTGNLQKIKGVMSVEVNIVSGSVLVYYQPAVITPELLFVAIIKLLDLESEFLRTPEPALATELRQIGVSLNRTFYELTGGMTDFHTLLLVSLVVYGVYMFRKDPVRAFPGGFTLMWWAYSSILSRT